MLKPDYCYKSHCPLSKLGYSFSVPDGKGTAGVAIIGEGLGGDEAIDGKPFRPHAQAGSKLEEAFRLSGRGFTRDMFLIWNIIACQPPGNRLEGMWYEDRAISSCKEHFNRVVGEFHTPFTRTILALGNIPLRVLTGVTGQAKDKQSISYLRGYVLDSEYGPIIGSYHPSFLKRGNPNFTPVLVADLEKAVDVARGKITDYPGHKDYVKPNYIEYPGLDDVESFYNRVVDNERLIVSCDIETPTSKDLDEDEREELEEGEIVQIQFSVEKKTGIAIPWKEPYLGFIGKILATRNNKLGYNWWNFDRPRVTNAGCIVNGKVIDLMWCFKHWHPRLERALQKVACLFGFPFPWKHLFGANLQYYGCSDVDAPLWIWEKLPRMMKEVGIWEGYKESVLGLDPILERARKVGIPVNEERRVELFYELSKRKDRVNGELQKGIPDEIRNISPKRKMVDSRGKVSFSYGYIREPKVIEQARGEYRRVREILEGQGKKVAPFWKFVRKKYGLSKKKFAEIDKDTGEIVEIKRWCKMLEFKPSKEGIVRYLKWKQRELLREPDRRVEDKI